MSQGNRIVMTDHPRGVELEGIIGDTSSPGTIMQVKAATALSAFEPTWIAAAVGADGDQVLGAVLTEDRLQGKLITDAYVNGTKCFLYCPIAGEYMNLLCGEIGGTANYFTIGDRLFIDAESGLLVPESGTGTSFALFAIVLETTVGLAGSSLVFCFWVGG